MIGASFVVIFEPSPWLLASDTRTSETLGISGMMSVLLYANEMNSGWKTLGSFRMGASHQEDPSMIRGLEFSDLPPDLCGNEKDWRLS